MMDDTMIAKTVTDLKALRAKRDELDTQIESLEKQIKDEMTSQDKYEFSGDGWKVTWSLVTQRRFSQSDFQKVYPDLFEQFKKPSESRRFNLY